MIAQLIVWLIRLATLLVGIAERLQRFELELAAEVSAQLPN